MKPNRPEPPIHNEYIMVASILLVAAGLIGLGAVDAKLLLVALPAAAILLLLLPQRDPAKDAPGAREGAGHGGSRRGDIRAVKQLPRFHGQEEPREERIPQSHPLYSIALQKVVMAHKDIRHLRKIADRLDDPPVSDSIRELCGIAEAIGENVKADPGVLLSVQRFYDYYLRTAKMLWSQYEVLVRSPFYNKEMEYQVKRIENLLQPLHRNFERHLARSMRGELSRVELEVNTLESVMRSEG